MGSKQKKKGSNFLAQGAILAAAGIIVKLISLLYRVPVTNILGDKGQGYYSIAYEIYALALLLTSYSMPLAVSKLVSARVALGERRNAWKLFRTALLMSMCLGLVIALIFYFGADFIAVHILTSPYAAYPLRFLAPGLFVVATIATLRGYLQGLGTMIPTALSQILEQVVNAIAAITGATVFMKLGTDLAKSEGISQLKDAYGAAGATLGPVLGATMALLFLGIVFLSYRRILKRQLKRDKSTHEESGGQLAKIILLTCAPVLLSTAVYNISQSFDVVLFNKIMSVQGHTAKEYTSLWGIFSGKYNVWINVPLAMANALGASMIPSLTAAVTTGNRRQIHQKISLVIRTAMIIAIPSFVGLAVMGGPIMGLLYRGDVETPAKMMQIGAVSVVFFCLSTVTNAVLQGINKMTTPVKNATIALVIHLIAVFLMLVMPKWNIYSVVIGNVIFSFCMCVLNARAIRNAIGYKQEVKKSFLLPLLSATVMGVFTFLFYHILRVGVGAKAATVPALLLAVVVYGVMMLLTGGMTEEDLQSMPKGSTMIRIFKKLHLLRSEE